MPKAAQTFTIPDHRDNPDIAKEIINHASVRCDGIARRVMTFRKLFLRLAELPDMDEEARDVILLADQELDVIQMLAEGLNRQVSA